MTRVAADALSGHFALRAAPWCVPQPLIAFFRFPVIACLAAACAESALADAEDGVEFFEKRIRPVLAEHCYECHSADAKKVRGGLRLDSPEYLLKGGETGAAIVPGRPEESALLAAVRYADKDLQMPPAAKDGTSRKLAQAQIADLTEWVRLGAPMPRSVPLAVAQSSAHWAFQPLTNPAVPKPKDAAWPKTDIDRFILAKLEAAGMPPAPPADARTLLRRMSFDITGLPPSAEEVDAFVDGARANDGSEDRLGRTVDRLLASPRYGERWARHWLDLARYADTKGYVYAREERFFVHSHTYRDWVVRAFNDDLPYDRFLLLQLAADQLVAPDSPELAAMGFLTGGRRFLGVMHDVIDDRIDVVSRATMALTVACARCHDHKYDPIPTQDYYSLYGVFHDKAERLVPLGSGAADPAFVKAHEAAAKPLAEATHRRREEAAKRLRARVGDYLVAQLELEKYPEESFGQILSPDDIIPASVRRWRDFLQASKDAPHPIFAPWHALAALGAGEFEAKAPAALDDARRACGESLNPLIGGAFTTTPKSMREVAERYGKVFAAAEAQPEGQDAARDALRKFLRNSESPTTVPDVGIVDNELFFPTSACEELWKLQGKVDRTLIDSPAAPPHALVLFDRAPEPNPRVFKRGNPARRGEEVPRRAPLVIAGAERQPFQHGSGRLELAQTIASADNPLTARVMVNRIWQHHFGAGLVRTPSDFGLRAEPPSHPELLDWLARRFIESGGSVKAMHRLIMSSAVYQQGGVNAAAASIDPDHRLLAHFPRQRFDFEQMRDALLAVSGELDLKGGGKPVELLSAGNKRRTIYGLVDRQFLAGTFRVFDFANPDLHIAQRSATTVPQQALFFLNHTFVAARAKALAARPQVAGAATSERRVRALYRAILQRSPSDREVASAHGFVTAAEAERPSVPAAPVASAWSYGYGEYDRATQRVKSFTALPHFTGKAWQGGAPWPDAKLGWAQLTADGGHAGNDLQHAAIRRWTAPRDATLSIAGTMAHEHPPGDGVRAFLISSRAGELKSAEVHNSRAEMAVASVEVKKGDTIDFVVDFRAGLNSDMFTWPPILQELTGSALTWDAKKEFAGPATAAPPPLAPWEQYAQALLLSNEFAFVD